MDADGRGFTADLPQGSVVSSWNWLPTQGRLVMVLRTTTKITKFRTEQEEAEWWGTHDTSEIWRTGKRARAPKLPPAQTQFIKERTAAGKKPIHGR
jgi:hypothetical protein